MMISKKLAVAIMYVQALLGALGLLHEKPALEVCVACITVNVER
ncbi:hypothetical protein [Streptomyces sp. NPDC059593]